MIKLTNIQEVTVLSITMVLQEQVRSILTEPFHYDVAPNKHGMNCNVNSGSSPRNLNSLSWTILKF